jgi:hypothetical protein
MVWLRNDKVITVPDTSGALRVSIRELEMIPVRIFGEYLMPRSLQGTASIDAGRSTGTED